MRSRYNLEYCAWEDCTRGAAQGSSYCFEHNREVAHEALKHVGIVAPTGSNDLFEKCEACDKTKRKGFGCKTCKEAERELRENLEEDPDEVFGL